MRNKRKIITAVYRAIKESVEKYDDLHSSVYNRLKWEGYAGGYLQALSDVLLIFNDNIPNSKYQDIWYDYIIKLDEYQKD